MLASVFVLAFTACKNEADNTSIPSTVTPSSTIDTASTASTESEISSDITTSSETDTTSSKADATSSTESETTSSVVVHTHSFSPATCKSPAKCSCGETQGEPLEHIFTDSVCILCDFVSLNSPASRGNYECYHENNDGSISHYSMYFNHEAEFIILMGTKYSDKKPPNFDRNTPTLQYNDKTYYRHSSLTLGEGDGYNLVITDTSLSFDSSYGNLHFDFEYTGNSFVLKNKVTDDHPKGLELIKE